MKNRVKMKTGILLIIAAMTAICLMLALSATLERHALIAHASTIDCYKTGEWVVEYYEQANEILPLGDKKKGEAISLNPHDWAR